MFILNTTYITTLHHAEAWKQWLKEEALSDSPSFRNTPYKVFRIGHSAEEDQVSFAVQFEFDSMATLDLFQDELSGIHQTSLARRFGPQCVFFTTVLSHEKL